NGRWRRGTRRHVKIPGKGPPWPLTFGRSVCQVRRGGRTWQTNGLRGAATFTRCAGGGRTCPDGRMSVPFGRSPATRDRRPEVPMPTDHNPDRLLHGPYTPPPLRRGDKATCLFRDGDVVITGWSDGPIPWPRCRRPGTHGGGSGLLVDEELARAVRLESSLAI